MKKNAQLSSFDILVLVNELQKSIVGSFINKVYQPTKSDLIIRLNVPTDGSNLLLGAKESQNNSKPKYQQIDLVIKLGKYFYAASKGNNTETTSDVTPGSYAMLLRKHLKNGKINDIHQHEFDRIIMLEIQKKEMYQLVIELFGDGNVILLKDKKIIQPLLPQTWSFRTLRAGSEYKFPPARVNPRIIENNEFNELISTSNKDLVRTLIMDLSLPGKYAEEICHRLALDKNKKTSQLTVEELDKIFDCIRTIFQNVETEPEALLIYNDEKMTELLEVKPIRLALNNQLYSKKMESYNSAVEHFYNPKFGGAGVTSKTVPKELREVTEKVTVERARLLRQLEQQKKAIEKFSTDVKLNHAMGEAIYTNYKRCEEVLNEINELRAEVESQELSDQLSSKKDILELNLFDEYVILNLEAADKNENLNVKLSFRKNVIENANSYYNKSKLTKEKLRGAEKALKKSQVQLKNLSSKMDKIKKQTETKPKTKIVKHFWFEKYHWLITSKDNIVVAGRDAKTNDQVVKKYLKDKDRYCHADVSGAASVVVKHNPDEDEIPEETLTEACELAVIFSKAWNAKIGSGTAYWVKPDQVSKTPQSGEYLARGAFVIRGKRNFVINIKLKLALGEIQYNDHYKLMAGPVSAVKMHSDKYVILVPGEKKKNAIANELSKLFNVAVDEILSLLPSGEFAIVKKIGFKE